MNEMETESKEKIQGAVKWFSNTKGYGFITPVEGSSFPDDIFVHQSAIHSDGYRTLDEQWQVEFEVSHDDDGKPKADNVTAIGGGPCNGPRKPRPPRRRRRRTHHDHDYEDEIEYDDVEHVTGNSGDGEIVGSGTIGIGESYDNGGGSGGGGGGGDMTTEHEHSSSIPGRRGRRSERDHGRDRNPHQRRPRQRRPRDNPREPREPQPIWHETLSEDVKQSLTDNHIRMTTGTIDISYHNARIKLGTRNYASLANEDGVLVEGSFQCESDGVAVFEWKRALRFTTSTTTGESEHETESGWNVFLDLSSFPSEISLMDESIKAVGVDETMLTLMGEGTADPRPALEANGFEMRRVVLTTKRR